VLGDRPVPIDHGGEPDLRKVIEAFPAAAGAGPEMSLERQIETPPELDPTAAAIMEMLRKSHDRIEGSVQQARQEAAQATHAATEALTRTAGMADMLTALPERVEAAEQQVTYVAERAIAAIAQSDQQNKTLAAAKAATTIVAAQKIGERIGASLAAALDRLPGLVMLGATIVLFRDVLPEPSTMKLAALALFGACGVAPAVWLSSRRK